MSTAYASVNNNLKRTQSSQIQHFKPIHPRKVFTNQIFNHKQINYRGVHATFHTTISIQTIFPSANNHTALISQRFAVSRAHYPWFGGITFLPHNAIDSTATVLNGRSRSHKWVAEELAPRSIVFDWNGLWSTELVLGRPLLATLFGKLGFKLISHCITKHAIQIINIEDVIGNQQWKRYTL